MVLIYHTLIAMICTIHQSLIQSISITTKFSMTNNLQSATYRPVTLHPQLPAIYPYPYMHRLEGFKGMHPQCCLPATTRAQGRYHSPRPVQMAIRATESPTPYICWIHHMRHSVWFQDRLQLSTINLLNHNYHTPFNLQPPGPQQE